jgi:hypothetical protein
MTLEDFYINKNYLFQLGNGLTDYLLFQQLESETEYQLSLKAQYEELNNGDGAIRTNLSDRNYLSAVEIPISYVLKDTKGNISLVKKSFLLPPQKAFFFNVEADGWITVYFNPNMDVVNPYSPKNSSRQEYGQREDVINATLKTPTPFSLQAFKSI